MSEEKWLQDVVGLHIDIDKIREKLKCSEQEALLYYICYHLYCLHFHVDQLLMPKLTAKKMK